MYDSYVHSTDDSLFADVRSTRSLLGAIAGGDIRMGP